MNKISPFPRTQRKRNPGERLTVRNTTKKRSPEFCQEKAQESQKWIRRILRPNGPIVRIARANGPGFGCQVFSPMANGPAIVHSNEVAALQASMDFVSHIPGPMALAIRIAGPLGLREFTTVQSCANFASGRWCRAGWICRWRAGSDRNRAGRCWGGPRRRLPGFPGSAQSYR